MENELPAGWNFVRSDVNVRAEIWTVNSQNLVQLEICGDWMNLFPVRVTGSGSHD